MRRNILTFREVTFLYGWIILYFLLETALVFFIYKFQAILVANLNQTSKKLPETSVFVGKWLGENTQRVFWPKAPTCILVVGP